MSPTGWNKFPSMGGDMSPVEKSPPPRAPPSACESISLIRTYWYFFLVEMSVCVTSGLGWDRAIAAMTASFSSSESTGPLFSRSSWSGALASIAASARC